MSPYEARIARERLRLQLATSMRDRAEGEHDLAELTRAINAVSSPDPIRALAQRLGVDRRGEDFLTFVIACCTDPVGAAALFKMQGPSSAQGAAITSYAALSGAGDEARELALALVAGHPLVEHGVLETPSQDAVTPPLKLWP